MSHRGILLVLRAAAVLIIATGVNDVIAGALKSYDPLYVYLGAVALVVWLDGLLLGSLVAVTAIALYTLLFLPRPAPLAQLSLPVAAFVAVLLLVGALRAVVVARRRRASFDPFPVTATPLLEPPPPPPPDMSEVLSALADLRSELRDELRRERDAPPDQTLQTLQLVAEARSQADHARTEANQARSEADRARTEADQARSEVDRAQAEVGRERSLREQLQNALNAAHDDQASAVRRVTDLELAASQNESALSAARRELDDARHKHDLERGRADGEASLRAQLDVELTAERQRTVSAIAERAMLASRVAELEQSLVAERERAEAGRRDNAARVEELERSLASERTRIQRELDAQTQSQASRVAELEQSLQSERERAAAAMADRERMQRELDAQAQSHASRLTELEQSLASERERADAALAEFDSKLQSIVNHLAADHEADLGKVIEEREESRAEVRSLGKRLSTLQRKFDEERTDSAGVLAETRAVAETELARLRHRIEELEHVPAPVTEARPRVLIAHPDAELRAAARASLERAGYEIVSAADGLEALRTAIAQRPDVVIADAVMPKMDGRELCQLLKSQEKTAHIRVILLARAGDDRSHGDLPPDQVLHKPVPLETLKATLANLIAASSSGHEA